MALSKIKANSITDDSITVDQIADNAVHGRRNLIINGAMQVAQRGTSITGITAAGYRTCDRMLFSVSGAGTWTVIQSTDSPDGFSNSFRVDCTTAKASLDAGNFLIVETKIEGQNVQHLMYGDSTAKNITASFYVKSNKTGTYVLELRQPDSGRLYSKAYTIDAANTWEYKTLTFPGDVSGTINNDNGPSLNIHFWLASGSTYSSGSIGTSWHTTNANRAAGVVNLADSTDNDWSVTGVQLEVGDKATPFEHRSFGEELALCQRYFQRLQDPTLRGAFTGQLSGGASRLAIPTYAKFRANPTISMSGTFNFWNGGDVYTGSASTGTFAAPDGFEIDITINSTTNLTKGMAAISYTTNSTTKIIDLDAEM